MALRNNLFDCLVWRTMGGISWYDATCTNTLKMSLVSELSVINKRIFTITALNWIQESCKARSYQQWTDSLDLESTPAIILVTGKRHLIFPAPQVDLMSVTSCGRGLIISLTNNDGTLQSRPLSVE